MSKHVPHAVELSLDDPILDWDSVSTTSAPVQPQTGYIPPLAQPIHMSIESNASDYPSVTGNGLGSLHHQASDVPPAQYNYAMDHPVAPIDLCDSQSQPMNSYTSEPPSNIPQHAHPNGAPTTAPYTRDDEDVDDLVVVGHLPSKKRIAHPTPSNPFAPQVKQEPRKHPYHFHDDFQTHVDTDTDTEDDVMTQDPPSNRLNLIPVVQPSTTTTTTTNTSSVQSHSRAIRSIADLVDFQEATSRDASTVHVPHPTSSLAPTSLHPSSALAPSIPSNPFKPQQPQQPQPQQHQQQPQPQQQPQQPQQLLPSSQPRPSTTTTATTPAATQTIPSGKRGTLYDRARQKAVHGGDITSYFTQTHAKAIPQDSDVQKAAPPHTAPSQPQQQSKHQPQPPPPQPTNITQPKKRSALDAFNETYDYVKKQSDFLLEQAAAAASRPVAPTVKPPPVSNESKLDRLRNIMGSKSKGNASSSSSSSSSLPASTHLTNGNGKQPNHLSIPQSVLPPAPPPPKRTVSSIKRDAASAARLLGVGPAFPPPPPPPSSSASKDKNSAGSDSNGSDEPTSLEKIRAQRRELPLPPLDPPLTRLQISNLRAKFRRYISTWNLLMPPPVSFRPAHLVLTKDGKHTNMLDSDDEEDDAYRIDISDDENDVDGEHPRDDESLNNNYLRLTDSQRSSLEHKHRIKQQIKKQKAREHAKLLQQLQDSLIDNRVADFNKKQIDITQIPRPFLRKQNYFNDVHEYRDYYLPLMMLDLHASLCNDYERNLIDDPNYTRLGARYSHARCLHNHNQVVTTVAGGVNSAFSGKSSTDNRGTGKGNHMDNDEAETFHQRKQLKVIDNFCECRLDRHYSFHLSQYDSNKQMIKLHKYQYSDAPAYIKNRNQDNQKQHQHGHNNENRGSTDQQQQQQQSDTRGRSRQYNNNNNKGGDNNSQPTQKNQNAIVGFKRVPIEMALETENTLCIVIPEYNFYVQPHRPHKESYPIQTTQSRKGKGGETTTHESIEVNQYTAYLEELRGSVPLVHMLGVIFRSQNKSINQDQNGELTVQLFFNDQLLTSLSHSSNRIPLSSIPVNSAQLVNQFEEAIEIYHAMMAKYGRRLNQNQPCISYDGPIPLRLRVYPLNSLVTATREFVAMHTISTYPISYALFNPVLSPLQAQQGEDRKAGGSSSSVVQAPPPQPAITTLSKREQFDAWMKIPEALRHHFQKVLNPSQLTAVQAATEEGNSKLPAITLLQGPPGTGKTRTIIALLNIIHIKKYLQRCDIVITNTYHNILERCLDKYFTSAATKVLENKSKDSGVPVAAEGSTAAAQKEMWTIYNDRPIIDKTLLKRVCDAVGIQPPQKSYRPKLLVCAPSNAGVDEIIARLIETGMLDGNMCTYKPVMLRVGNSGTIRDSVRDKTSVQEQLRELLSLPYSKLVERYNKVTERLNNNTREMRKTKIAIGKFCVSVIHQFFFKNGRPVTELKPALELINEKYSTAPVKQFSSDKPDIHRPSVEKLGQMQLSPELCQSITKLTFEQENVKAELQQLESLMALYSSFGLTNNINQKNVVAYDLHGATTSVETIHRTHGAGISSLSTPARPEESLLDRVPHALSLGQVRDITDLLISRADIVFGTCSATDELIRDEESSHRQNAAKHKSNNTPSGSGSSASDEDIDTSLLEWDSLLVDEACQCSEANVLVSLTRKVKHCVLVGDPKQLPATVFLSRGNNSEFLTKGDDISTISTVVSRAGNKPGPASSSDIFHLGNAKQITIIPQGLVRVFERSLFERLQQGGHSVHMLTLQYRMHPLIATFSARHFYHNRISTAPNVFDRVARGEPYYLHPQLGALRFFNITPASNVWVNPQKERTKQKKGGEKDRDQSTESLSSPSPYCIPVNLPQSITIHEHTHWNPYEAAAICQMVYMMILNLGISGSEIGIITYYQAQRTLLAYWLPRLIRHFVHHPAYARPKEPSGSGDDDELYTAVKAKLEKARQKAEDDRRKQQELADAHKQQQQIHEQQQRRRLDGDDDDDDDGSNHPNFYPPTKKEPQKAQQTPPLTAVKQEKTQQSPHIKPDPSGTSTSSSTGVELAEVDEQTGESKEPLKQMVVDYPEYTYYPRPNSLVITRDPERTAPIEPSASHPVHIPQRHKANSNARNRSYQPNHGEHGVFCACHICTRLMQEIELVDVGTVDGFQGREKPVIIVSCVRSKHNMSVEALNHQRLLHHRAHTTSSVGFLRDGRRVNVSLTRGVNGLFVFGDRDTLYHGHSHWESFIKIVEEQGVLTHNFDIHTIRKQMASIGRAILDTGLAVEPSIPHSYTTHHFQHQHPPPKHQPPPQQQQQPQQQAPPPQPRQPASAPYQPPPPRQHHTAPPHHQPRQQPPPGFYGQPSSQPPPPGYHHHTPPPHGGGGGGGAGYPHGAPPGHVNRPPPPHHHPGNAPFIPGPHSQYPQPHPHQQPPHHPQQHQPYPQQQHPPHHYHPGAPPHQQQGYPHPHQQQQQQQQLQKQQQQAPPSDDQFFPPPPPT